MSVIHDLRERIHDDAERAGPDSLIGVTEGGKAALALLFCLTVAAALIAAFWTAS
jgi:hypothetical protein